MGYWCRCCSMLCQRTTAVRMHRACKPWRTPPRMPLTCLRSSRCPTTGGRFSCPFTLTFFVSVSTGLLALQIPSACLLSTQILLWLDVAVLPRRYSWLLRNGSMRAGHGKQPSQQSLQKSYLEQLLWRAERNHPQQLGLLAYCWQDHPPGTVRSDTEMLCRPGCPQSTRRLSICRFIFVMSLCLCHGRSGCAPSAR